MITPIETLLDTARIVPVLAFQSTEEALAISTVLVEAGLTLLEITLRTPASLDCISAVSQALPAAHVGAGTILDAAQLLAARAAGATWGVSPGLTPELADCIREQAFPFLPGVATVSEAMVARAYGFSTLKLFPAQVCGGLAFLRSVAPVLPDISFCPTGGLNAENASDYLGLRNVRAIGGTWMIKRLGSGEFDNEATRAAALACRKLRSI